MSPSSDPQSSPKPVPAADVGPGDPFCGNCGYSLKGLQDSSKCPECGKPIIEVLMRKEFGRRTFRRYRSKATLFGWPLIDIALGSAPNEWLGKARGIIAIGDLAIGFLAVGGITCGIVSFGGVGIGLFTLCGMSLGLLTAVGGVAISAGLATGGTAIGTIAFGSFAVGFIAQGVSAVGVYTRDINNWRRHGPPIFDHLHWLLGRFPPHGLDILLPEFYTVGLPVFFAAIIGLVVWRRFSSGPDGKS
jgi:predicted RNA-binding Zn-ribbon protein involved in translation (DUF1610 family)